MKIRGANASEGKIQLQMTPMIDIVFQLLVFFIMTFKIVAQEGDFKIKMPLATQQSGLPEESPVLTMHVRLRAGPAGHLLPSGGIVVNGELVFDTPAELHNYVISIVGGDEPSARDDAEVELDCDYGLNYEHVIEAITAVSGYVDESTGETRHLIQKIKFAPPPEVPE
ncbi:MAG: ExbD/TolR family protein [Planctomycetota bacterium]